jgi:hypothetical protein
MDLSYEENVFLLYFSAKDGILSWRHCHSVPLFLFLQNCKAVLSKALLAFCNTAGPLPAWPQKAEIELLAGSGPKKNTYQLLLILFSSYHASLCCTGIDKNTVLACEEKVITKGQ